MIYAHGRQTATPAQRRLLREIADDSFVRTLPIDFGPLPCAQDWKPDITTSVALRMRCVEPHTDGWVGEGEYPRRYAAFFWVVEMPKYEELFLQVGTEARRMREGDFVVFKDSVLHSVISRRVWRGCAYQAKPARLSPKDKR